MIMSVPIADEGVARAPLGERADPERVRVEDPVLDEVVERAGRERVRGGGDADAGEQDPDGPSPSGAGRMPVGEQQDEERDQRDDEEGVVGDERDRPLAG